MTTEYLRYNCKTCGRTSYTRAVNVPKQNNKWLLRCNRGHQHVYGSEEIESLLLTFNPDLLK
jgi:hypothetical protein